MLELLGEANTSAFVGLLGGLCLGLAARLGRFCTLGAIEDCLYGHDWRRLRMWMIAIGVAIITTHLAMALDFFVLQDSAYLDRVWNPYATITGGLIFGYGMAMSGNCGYGALARAGGGDIRAFLIVVVMGLSAYFVMSGPLAHLRIWLFPVETNASTPQSITGLFETWGLPPMITGLAIGGAILLFALSNKDILKQPKYIFWGAVVGLAVMSGWLGTSYIFHTGFGAEPIKTHSFVAPIGDTIYYSMTASGTELSFSVGSVVGVVLGAFFASYSKGHFRLEACDDPRELKRQLSGAVLMGVGAILAVGCSVGQGISAISVLAFSAPVTLAAIIAGAALGLRQMISGGMSN